MIPVASAAPPRHIVLYDDECPLCTFQMRVLTWLDWFGTLSLIPLSHESAARLAPHCIRFVGMRLPLLVPVALVLWIPGVIQVAEVVYQWISRNRLLLSRVFGCKGACAILPPRARAQDDLPS